MSQATTRDWGATSGLKISDGGISTPEPVATNLRLWQQALAVLSAGRHGHLDPGALKLRHLDDSRKVHEYLQDAREAVWAIRGFERSTLPVTNAARTASG